MVSPPAFVQELDSEISFTDLPVNNEYVKDLDQYVLEITGKSRWFNAIAFRLQFLRNNSFKMEAPPGAVWTPSECLQKTMISETDNYHIASLLRAKQARCQCHSGNI